MEALDRFRSNGYRPFAYVGEHFFYKSRTWLKPTADTAVAQGVTVETLHPFLARQVQINFR